ncbi:hypothetical protein BCL32_7101 [Rhizobium mongolense USDA 1844]|uniref:Uncharacterized protein n=1 Tax=Rhizobium mongolense USDA 1844 TaxID=1079460 RepID=A0A559SWF8_9HYPH|nr:hypothetical protein BCL32_7101 [Rhizobium mongolense USDA 1844]
MSLNDILQHVTFACHYPRLKRTAGILRENHVFCSNFDLTQRFLGQARYGAEIRASLTARGTLIGRYDVIAGQAKPRRLIVAPSSTM